MSTRFRTRIVQLLSVGAFIVVMLTMGMAMAGEWGGNQQSTNPKNLPAGNNAVSSVPAYAPQEVVVRLRTDTGRFAADNGVVQGYEAALRGAPVYLVSLDPGVDVFEAANNFSQSPDVEYAHPNFVLDRSHPIQGSYPFSDQNSKGDIAQQCAATRLGLDQAHQLSLGTGVLVGVIDGGIDVTHPALAGKAVSGYDFIDHDNDANDEPGGAASGHGTFVAGIIHLVAPAATIRSYRVMDASGDGDGFAVAQAIEQAVVDGCSIINVSLALTARNLAVRDAIDRATGQGVLVVCGAGNLRSDVPVYPAAEASALAVGALDSLDQKAIFSSFGSYVDLSAPGNNVYSAYQKPYYAWWSGTSFSAPFVSGLAALAMQRFPGASGFEIRNRLMATAGDIDAENPGYIGNLGAGILNPYAALTASVTGDSAVFIPETLYYTYLQYSQILVMPVVRGILLSTNGPSPYTHRLVDTGSFSFVRVDDSAGTTNDTVAMFVNVTQVIGTYYNRIAFDVVGVPLPAYATVVLNVVPNDTLGPLAWTNPPEVTISAPATSDSLIVGTVMLYSTNAPADYYAEIPSGPSGFLSLITASGRTNEAVRFGVTPNHVFSPGFYSDTIVYHVDGIPEPAKLVVHLNALDTVPTDQHGYVFPDFSYYTAPAYTSTISHTGLVVGSYGTPKAFTCHLLDTPDFTQLTKSSGTTWDSIFFDIVTTIATSPGVYRDTIVIDMPEAPNSPFLAVLTLRVDTSYGNNACSLPGDVNDNGLAWEQADLDNLTSALATGNISILGSMLGNSDVNSDCRIDAIDRNIMTFYLAHPDSIASIGCVWYCSGYTFAPDTGGTPTGDSAWTSPQSIEVTVADGTTGIVNRQVTLSSSNAPANWYAYHIDSAGSWLQFDSIGQTNAALTIGLDLTGLAPGYYFDQLTYVVAGIQNPVHLPVMLNIATSDSVAPGPVREVALSNYPNPFNPSTECIFSLPVASQVSLQVYDLLGREVVTLVDEYRAAGTHRVPWHGRTASGASAASGVYLYRLTANGVTLTRKMLLLK